MKNGVVDLWDIVFVVFGMFCLMYWLIINYCLDEVYKVIGNYVYIIIVVYIIVYYFYFCILVLIVILGVDVEKV